MCVCVWFMVLLKSAMTCDLNVFKFQAWVIQPIKSNERPEHLAKQSSTARRRRESYFPSID